MLKDLIIVRGGGDLASGTIYKLYQAGFPLLILETDRPAAIRRNVAFSEAVYNGTHTIEGVTATHVKTVEEACACIEAGGLPVLTDPAAASVQILKPAVVVDAILAKKNLGTSRDMAPVTIGLGPGFTAGEDVDAVIETKRGHYLGRVIYEGQAIANTGIPGIIGGFGKERVMHSPAEGILHNVRQITDFVEKGDVIAVIQTCDGEEIPVHASLDGILRGLIRDGYPVTKGFKIADIDPRSEQRENCFSISDKARCIAGGVLEAIMHLRAQKEKP